MQVHKQHLSTRQKCSDCVAALGWRTQGKRAVGRPKKTWSGTAEVERRQAQWYDWSTKRDYTRDVERHKRAKLATRKS